MAQTHTATHCNTLQHTTPCCNTLQHNAPVGSSERLHLWHKPPKIENSNLHGFEVHTPSSKGTKLQFQVIKAIINQSNCTILQHAATRCNTLHHAATHCTTMHWLIGEAATNTHTATYCNTLQHTATHCNTLQHTAAHCNTQATVYMHA